MARSLVKLRLNFTFYILHLIGFLWVESCHVPCAKSSVDVDKVMTFVGGYRIFHGFRTFLGLFTLLNFVCIHTFGCRRFSTLEWISLFSHMFLDTFRTISCFQTFRAWWCLLLISGVSEVFKHFFLSYEPLRVLFPLHFRQFLFIFSFFGSVISFLGFSRFQTPWAFWDPFDFFDTSRRLNMFLNFGRGEFRNDLAFFTFCGVSVLLALSEYFW
jgi:hypothetical protein